jgi:hypothetical protein
MDVQQYLDMCDMMGWEPDIDQLPPSPADMSVEVQQALVMLSALQDRWDGMSGTWMGKDYTGLMDIMDIYNITDRRAVFELIKLGENELGKYYKQKAKEQESLSKAKKVK